MSLILSSKYPERYLSATTSPSSALALDELDVLRKSKGDGVQIELTAEGADIIVAFGGSSVSANTTVDGTTKKRDPGMYKIKNGAILVFNIIDASLDYISTITESGSGNLTIRTGFGE